MVDLTTLEGKDTPGKVASLCQKALHPHPGLDCPSFLVQAVELLRNFGGFLGIVSRQQPDAKV